MKKTIRDLLTDKIPENDLKNINRSFEIVGDIAITEIKEEHQKYEKEIGEAILKINTSLKTVLKKSGIHTGEFRTQQLTHIAGVDKKETVYTENGIRLHINPESVYFSAKLSTERENLLSDLDDDTRVLVFFSGCGPYSFVALKKNPDLGRITSIEINPEGHKYALKSLDLNKNIIKKSHLYFNMREFLIMHKIPFYEKEFLNKCNRLMFHFINGDVNEEVKKLKVLPTQKEFLEDSNKLIKNNDALYIFEELEHSKNKEIYFNFDKMKDVEDIVPYIILFLDKFSFIIKSENEVYEFKTDREKGLLINYLERECETPLENIGEYDEIFMPLPKDADKFLDAAFEVVAKNGIIHMYGFCPENEFPSTTEKQVYDSAKKNGREIDIISTRKVGQYAPGKFRVCCDFIVK